MFGKYNSQTFLSIFLQRIAQMKYLYYLCAQLQQNLIQQQKLLPMSYIFAVIVLAALFKALNS